MTGWNHAVKQREQPWSYGLRYDDLDDDGVVWEPSLEKSVRVFKNAPSITVDRRERTVRQNSSSRSATRRPLRVRGKESMSRAGRTREDVLAADSMSSRLRSSSSSQMFSSSSLIVSSTSDDGDGGFGKTGGNEGCVLHAGGEEYSSRAL